MGLESTQPITEMSTKNLPGGKGWLECKADDITAICDPIVGKMWEPRRLKTPWASTACYRDSSLSSCSTKCRAYTAFNYGQGDCE
jgi:hypothetical protein